MLAAVAAGFASCSIREMGAPEVPANRIAVTVNASFDGTKTVFGTPADGKIPVSWSETGEILALAEISNGVRTQIDTVDAYSVENGGANAKFQFNLVQGEASSYDYVAVYPSSLFRAKPGKTTPAGAVFDFAFSVDPQVPTATSPDPSACLLFSKVSGLTAQPTELNMAFEHMCGYGKVSIKDVKLAAGEAIESLLIQFPATDTTGARIGYMPDGSLKYETGVSSTLTIKTDNLETASGSFDAWFATRPFVFKNGENATVSIVTNKRTFKKEITAPADLSFEAGVATAFAVDMSTAEAPEIFEADLELAFDFSSPQTTLPDWPTTKAANGEYVYPLNGTDYSFYLGATFAAAAQLTVNAAGSYLGLPVVKGYKLIRVVLNSPKGGTKYIGAISADTAGANIVKGGEQQTWTAAGAHTYTLEETVADTRYYVYGVGPLPINKITLYYDEVAPVGDVIASCFETVFEGGRTAWKAGDVIGVIDQTATTPFVAKADGAEADFIGTLSEGTTQYAALYPYNEEMGVNASNKDKVVVSNARLCPTVQTVADGSNLPIYAPFVAKGEKLSFKPLGAAIKFTVDSDYAGKFSAIKIADPSNKAKMANSDTAININLSSGNAASNASFVSYIPESGSIAAGTYYLGIYTPNTRYTLTSGLALTFTMLTGQTAELTIPAEVVGASEVVPGMIIDLGTLKPELPGMATYNPYNYPADPAPAFSPIPNMLVNKVSITVAENAEVVDNVVVFKAFEGASTAGARIGAYASDGTAKVPAVAGAKTFGNTYFTTTGWKANDYVLYEIPVSQTVKGDVAFSFSLSCGKADVITGNWTAKWSKDNTNWESIETFYTGLGEKTGSFCINDNGTTYNNGVSTAKIVIPDAKALNSGDKLYVKLILDTDATNAAQTLRMNGGSLVYAWPTNMDFSSDSKVILSQNFASLCKCSYDVLGVYNGDYYTEKASAPAIEGWEFSTCHERISHVLVNGSATTTGYILTPALTALTEASDIIVSFKASSVETPSVNVAVVGAGTVDEDGPFWTKPLADSPYNWTVCYVKISGADATTKVKITSNANLDVDDIVITK